MSHFESYSIFFGFFSLNWCIFKNKNISTSFLGTIFQLRPAVMMYQKDLFLKATKVRAKFVIIVLVINSIYYLYMRQLFLSSFLLVSFLLLLIGCSRSVDQEEGLYSGLKDQDSMMVWGIRQFT